jgi:hypothetical protein
MFRHFSFCPYASFVVILYTFRTISWVCILEESDIDVPLVSLTWHETHSAHVVIAAESTAEDRVCTMDIRPIMLTNSLRCSSTGKNWNEQEIVTTQKCETKPTNVNVNIRIMLFDHCKWTNTWCLFYIVINRLEVNKKREWHGFIDAAGVSRSVAF